MNGPRDLSVTHSSATPDPKNCSLVSIIPIVGMSSCRGRAEAFARRLSSKLRTLGTQADEADVSQEDEPIINGGNINTWVTSGDSSEQTVTDLQPLRHESDSFFDFDCELESPGSPVDECEYLRLIESTSNTPHNSAAESGYACASVSSSNSSGDGRFFDVNSDNETCTGHLEHQHPYQQRKKTHICHSHKQEMSDEVDCPPTMTVSACQYKSCQNVQDLAQQILPNEGPDIELANNEKDHVENPEQCDIPQEMQGEILQKLHKKSLEYQKDESDNNKSLEREEDEEAVGEIEKVRETEVAHDDETSEGQNTKQTLEIIIGQTESGDDVTNKVRELETETKKDTGNNNSTTTINELNESEISTETDKSKASHLHMDASDYEDCRPQRVRRCSSLKTGKTPPGTPGRKKIVRFADVLGLDLADVKTFLDEIPTIPKSAYEDLEIMESEPPLQLGPKSDKLLMPLFQQPGGLPTFLDIVREKQVSLENAAVTDSINQTITGYVRVRNLDFHKSVHIRYSLDGWRSFADLQANYVENSCDGFSDKFSFILFGNSLHIGQRLEFAVRFQCKGQQYWDNNYGANYCFQCLPTAVPAINTISTILPSHHSNHMAALLSPTFGDSWCTSFY